VGTNTERLPFEEAQYLFVRICNSMTRANLSLTVGMAKESMALTFPLMKSENQLGTVQYGGIRYSSGLSREVAAEMIKYVELRFNIKTLINLGLYDKLNIDSPLRTTDTDCIRFRFFYRHFDHEKAKKQTFEIIDKLSKVISDHFEQTMGIRYLAYGLDDEIMRLPRIESE
jgi:hypothetical protein